jgi:hypothetical protein
MIYLITLIINLLILIALTALLFEMSWKIKA